MGLKIKECAVQTFTKKWMSRILGVLIALLLFTYGVILFGLMLVWDGMIIDSMVRLSETLLNTLGVTLVSYLGKSYFESKAESRDHLIEKEMDLTFTRKEEDNRGV